MWQFCRDWDVRAFGESRDQEAAAKVDDVERLLDGPAGVGRDIGRAGSGTWSARFSATRLARWPRWAHTAHSVSSTRVVAALDRAVAGALSEGRRERPLGIYVQISLDGDVSRGGVDVSDSGSVDEICAQVEAADSLELVGLMGIPPLDWDPDTAFARLQSEHDRVQRVPSRCGGTVGGDVKRSRKCGQTWFDLCACRYRVIGSTTATVTVNSHSSHIFITDTGIPRVVEGSSDEHTA